MLGGAFEIITALQFSVLRAGERFFWENENLDAKTRAMISATTMTDLMRRDTNTTAHLQPDLFVAAPLRR